MDTRSRRTEGLILRSRDYREQDKLLTLASAAYGVETVLARGARRSGSSLRALSQPYCRVELLLSPPKNGVSFVQEGVPLESYITLDDGDLGRFAYAGYLCELLIGAWPPGRPQTELYALMLAAFSLLKLSDDHARTARMFELRLLRTQGWLALPGHCSGCGARIMGRRFALEPQDGQLRCEQCQIAAGGDGLLFSAAAVQTARRLLNAPLTLIPALTLPDDVARELELLCRRLLDHHLDYAPRARRLLTELLD